MSAMRKLASGQAISAEGAETDMHSRYAAFKAHGEKRRLSNET
jgi:hypothetical protein